RGKGIDSNALSYIAAHHNAADAVFVDGWTGKGAISRELAVAVVADVTGARQTGAVLLIVVLALGAGLLYGVADFFSGVAARRIAVLVATTINYAVATVVLVIVVLTVGGVWSPAAIASGVTAGLLAAVGFLTFTAALAAGPISLMTPLIALLSSAVPVAVALVLGDELEPIAWVAIVVAILGSVLIGLERRVDTRGAKPRTLLFAAISGLAFGFATVALDLAPADAGMVAVFLDTTSGLVLLLVLLGLARGVPAMRRVMAVLDAHPVDAHPVDAHPVDAYPVDDAPASMRAAAGPARSSSPHLDQVPAPGAARLGAARSADPRRRARLLAGVAGLLIGGANVLLMLALHEGSVAVVAVLVNLYPVATVLLAWIVLRERINAVQGTGVVLAVAASVMLGLV
ncbi:cysteine protease StiP domain-containing protein, partial [Agromyces humi]|uniref:cysteine protease StiP domain-containing protein n=1 Tax=Agromyces humi TaxID=1766800 RepID=UPI00135C1506